MKSINASILVGLGILLSSISLAQDVKFKDFKWPKKSFTRGEIPESLRSEDAVITTHYRNIRNEITNLSNFSTRCTEFVKYRIRIQTAKGLEDFSKVFMTMQSHQEIEFLDARTLKSNNKMVHLNAKDIKELEYVEPINKSNALKQYRFAIPGLEIGDEVEVVYKLKQKYMQWAGDVYFHLPLPTISSKVKFSHPKKIISDISIYNGLSQPKVSEAYGTTTYEWEQMMLPSLEGEHHSILALEVPYFSYAIRSLYLDENGVQKNFPLTKNKWSELYEAYDQKYKDQQFVGRAKSGYYHEWLEQRLGETSSADPADQFQYLFDYIRDHLEVVKMSEDETNNPMGYFLYSGRIDHRNLHILYRKLFKSLNLKFYVCFGRNRYNGMFDNDLIAAMFISEVMYGFEDKNGKIHFFMPSYAGYKYYMDEFPSYLEGTKVVGIHGKNFSSLSLETRDFLVPYKTHKVNKRLLKEQIRIDVKENGFERKCRETFKGSLSRYDRNEHQKYAEKEDMNLVSDEFGQKVSSFAFTEKRDKFPYSHSIDYDLVSDSNYLLEVEEGVYALKLEGLIEHDVLHHSEKKRDFKYYSPTLYTDEAELFLKINEAVSLENLDEMKTILSNDFGVYEMEVQALSENEIRVVSRYTVKKNWCEADQYHQLVDLNKSVKESLERSLFFKLK